MQSRWRVLLLRAWCFHGKWDGRWRTQKIGRRRHWCLPQTLCPLGAHSSNGGIWGHGQGAMPYLSSDWLQAFFKLPLKTQIASCWQHINLFLQCHLISLRGSCAVCLPVLPLCVDCLAWLCVECGACVPALLQPVPLCVECARGTTIP